MRPLNRPFFDESFDPFDRVMRSHQFIEIALLDDVELAAHTRGIIGSRGADGMT
jgi:hypothetical protein